MKNIMPAESIIYHTLFKCVHVSVDISFVGKAIEMWVFKLSTMTLLLAQSSVRVEWIPVRAAPCGSLMYPSGARIRMQ